MARVKRGVTARRRHRAVLELTKGQWGSRHKLYRRAHEAMVHSLAYAYRDRRDRKGQMRKLWIIRINAAARLAGVSYSTLMHAFKEAGIEINRKMLADLAVRDASAFQQLIQQATAR